MKYRALIKSTDELEITDFSEEITNKYKNIKVKGVIDDSAIISYTRESDGKEVMTTLEQLLEEWREKQIELIFDDFAERVAKKIAPKYETPPKMKQVMIPKHCIVASDDAVSSTKAIPAAELKRGKWEIKKDGLFNSDYGMICSECGNYLTFLKVNAGLGDVNYCPNCGAKMIKD